MKDNQSLWGGVAGGAIAGAIMTLILLRSPLATTNTIELPLSLSETPASTSATDHEEAVIDTVSLSEDSVVSIIITQDVPVYERVFENVPNTPFGNFFNFSVPQLRERGTQKQEIGGGSGFLISEDGLIVTNKHVVNQEGAEYTVYLDDGSKHSAEVIARDPVNDLAVLKIDGNNLPYLDFANSDELRVGQSVVAIGNALGEFSNTVSTGIVSGLGRSITAGDGAGQSELIEEVIQTDAAISRGNSGGPLLNLHGEVVGVNVAVALGGENIGFALPSNLVKSIVSSVQELGRIVRPYLGVRYVAITPAIQEANNLDIDSGILVIRGETIEQLAVVPGSPADKAGVTEGDIILEVDGQVLNSNTSLASIIQKKQVGNTVSLKLLSDGKEKMVTTTLDEYPSE